jgi:hypothetical protein
VIPVLDEKNRLLGVVDFEQNPTDNIQSLSHNLP